MARKRASNAKIRAKHVQAEPSASSSAPIKHSRKPEGFKPVEKINSTAEIQVSESIFEQVIGQERGIEVVRKAAKQKRNVLLVGTPGTGKSMLAQAMAELMPTEELQDILIVVNRENESQPRVKAVKAGEGKKIVGQERLSGRLAGSNANLFMMGFMMVSVFIALYFLPKYFATVIVAALLIGIFLMGAALMFAMQLSRGRLVEAESMKLIVDNAGKTKAPFVDATGSRAGALLGDVKHDPFQSLPEGTQLDAPGGKVDLEHVWNQMAIRYPDRVEKRENGYEALVLPPKEKVWVWGWKKGKLVKSRVWSLNRHGHSGRVVEARTREGKVATTPEHAFIVEGKDVKAKRLGKGKHLHVLN